jgi:hypothetical protein
MPRPNYCAACGASLSSADLRANQCYGCGAPLGQPAAAEIAWVEPADAAPGWGGETAEGQREPRGRGRRPPPTPSGRSSTPWIIIGVVVGVVVVIGLALLLLIPAFSRMRESANKALSAKNLSELTTAAHSFHNDHGHLPRDGGPSSFGNGTRPMPTSSP